MLATALLTTLTPLQAQLSTQQQGQHSQCPLHAAAAGSSAHVQVPAALGTSGFPDASVPGCGTVLAQAHGVISKGSPAHCEEQGCGRCLPGTVGFEEK